MAIRADLYGMDVRHWFAAALLLTCAPALAGAQDHALRAERARGVTGTAVVDAVSPAMANLSGRQRRSLDGPWQVLVDAYASGMGDWKAVWKDRHAIGKNDFLEYGFDDSETLDVPGDWNTQRPQLMWLEGSVWYRKSFDFDLAAAKRAGKRTFVHFGGANYRADVFLNGNKLGSHEGGFTPFQFELTEVLQQGENRLLVHVNNERRADGLPAKGFDWFNYGGLTRDVDLVETPRTYIRDYFIQLSPGSQRRVDGWVKLDGTPAPQPGRVRIPRLGIDVRTRTDDEGQARVSFESRFTLWSPQQPKLYRVLVSTPQDSVEEDIGFRSLAVRGDEILLNGAPIFLRGVNLHEEIQSRRAYSEEDARRLLELAKQLGANFVRLVHYPHNEHLVRLADRMGLLLWEEIPVYQGIDFSAGGMQAKLDAALTEMIGRDHNRAAVALWSIANETAPGAQRNAALAALAKRGRQLDPSRLITAALYAPKFSGNTLTVNDPSVASLDVVGINEYFGWYTPWSVAPEQAVWTPLGKPLLISEFGAESRYGHHGADDVASGWNEEFQAEFYRKQFRMIDRIPFARGVAPWVLMDYRSPVRLNPFQGGYNRKGLLSEHGERKLAWQVISDYYAEIRHRENEF